MELRRAASSSPATVGRGRRFETRVVVTDKAWLGITNEPAILEGYGPIHPMIAREQAPGSTLRRLITDELTDELLNFGRTTYAAPRALSDFVQGARHDLSARRLCAALPPQRPRSPQRLARQRRD